MKQVIIAVDFDGTIVQHMYPRIGKLVPGAKETINALAQNGVQLFLFTMRDGDTLLDAKQFCLANDIKINNFNKSPSQFSTSPKQYAHLYIDDAAVGCPLMNFNGHTVVDWRAICYLLHGSKLLTDEQYERISESILRSDK